MANTPEAPMTPEAACEDAALAVSPYCAPRYQFGMLLGADDFDLAVAYPRGKVRLHNAWLHREGVVWGFGVSATENGAGELRGEIKVDPGLALDALGHELHLEGAACVDVAAWYRKLLPSKPKALPELDGKGRASFFARVELRFHACLARPVPSMSEPCDQGTNGVAYSRTCETVEITLVPFDPKTETPRAYPYHLLRMLFGLEPAKDTANPTADEKAVGDALAAVEAAPPDQRAVEFLEAFRHFAALDVIGLSPHTSASGVTSFFPAPDDAPVVIAEIAIELEADKSGAIKLAKAKIDPTVRPSHVATSTIQELNLWPGAGARRDDDAGGPRVTSVSLSSAAKPPEEKPDLMPAAPAGLSPADAERRKRTLDITIETDKSLDPATVHASAFSVSSLDDRAWSTLTVHPKPEGKTVTLRVEGVPASYRRLRLIARGTGPMPLLGKNGIPLAGAASDPRPGRADDGNDYVHMWEGKGS